MRIVATLLALAASALAITVTAPTNTTGFSTVGQNTVSWNAVSTDPTNFTVVLVNMAKFPPYSQVLNALVQTSAGTVKVNPPSAGWPSGSGFQINLVADPDHLNSILAQSEQFSFVTPTGSSSVATSTSGPVTSGGTTLVVSNTANPPTPTNTDGTTDLNPTTSDTSTSPSNTNAAVSTGVQASFFGLVALVGAFLA